MVYKNRYVSMIEINVISIHYPYVSDFSIISELFVS